MRDPTPISCKQQTARERKGERLASILCLYKYLPAALHSAAAYSMCATARPRRRRLQTARQPACQLGRRAPPHLP